MPFNDRIFAIQPMHARAPQHPAFLPPQAHGATEITVLAAQLPVAVGIDPFGNQRDHRVRRVGIKLRALRMLETGDVASKLNNRNLHTQANSEIRNTVRACVANCLDLALDASFAEPTRHQDCIYALELASALTFDLL